MSELRSEWLTLGQLARASGLARASLLHYESLGLLIPGGRSAAGYRLYGTEELERLQTIRRFREAGLSLAAIGELLSGAREGGKGETEPVTILESRLLDLSQEVRRLRNQQQQLARLLALPEFRAMHRCRDKAAWVEMLRHAGFSDEDMRQWHREFERDHPAEHEAFLRSLGLAEEEIAAILALSRC